MKGPRITDATEEPRGDDRRRSPTPPPPVASSVLSRPSHYPLPLHSSHSVSPLRCYPLHAHPLSLQSRGAHVRRADVLHKVAVSRARRLRHRRCCRLFSVSPRCIQRGEMKEARAACDRKRFAAVFTSAAFPQVASQPCGKM